jgi:glycerol-3-phosphate dehydrogenase
MMQRNFGLLKNGPFDILVVGGGIYGAWTAYDAALRGLKVALVEKKDWGSGTSSASSKLIHGGLRYLEHYWFGLVKKSLLERKRLHSLGPHRIRPLRFVLPTYQNDRTSRSMLNLGLWLYDTMAGPGQPVKRHAALGRTDLLNEYPFLNPDHLTGGFTYGDCATDDARFCLEIADGALRAGVAAVNYAEVKQLLFSAGRVVGAAVEDRETGGTVEIKAGLTVNAAGPWGDDLLAKSGGDSPAGRTRGRLTKGVHLMMPPLPTKNAFLITARSDQRVLFLIPWYGMTILGTTDTDFSGDPDTAAVDQEDIAYLLSEINRAFNTLRWGESNIRAAFTGLRKLRHAPGRTPSATTREWVLEEPLPGLFITSGGKLTSARREAADTLDALAARLGKKIPGQTDAKPFPWAPAAGNPDWLADGIAAHIAVGLDAETAEAAVYRYGSSYPALHAIIREEPALTARIHPYFPFCQAEVLHAARNEMARTLEDVLRRRIPLSLLCILDRPAVTAVADLTGRTLGWNAERTQKEIEDYLLNNR